MIFTSEPDLYSNSKFSDFDYLRSDQLSTHHWSLLRVSKTNVFLTFEPDLDSNSDSLISIILGPIKFQSSLVTISDFLNRSSFDLKCKQTDRQTNEFFSYDPPYSRGNIYKKRRILFIMSKNSSR